MKLKKSIEIFRLRLVWMIFTRHSPIWIAALVYSIILAKGLRLVSRRVGSNFMRFVQSLTGK